MKRSGGLPQDVQESIVELIKSDDDVGLEQVLIEYNQFNPILSKVPKAPKPLQKNPRLICAAAFYGSEKCLRYLFQANVKPEHTDQRGRTIAHYAIYCGKTDILLVIVEMGISLDTMSKNLKRPIHIAAKLGFLDTCQYLWTIGIDMKENDKQGLQPIHYAALNEHFDVVEFLEGAGCKLTDPMANKSNIYNSAIRRNRYELLIYLGEHKIPQLQAESGNFPIHEAVRSKIPDTVRLLLDNGADPCCFNQKHETPLHIAARNGLETVVLMLLDAMDSPFPDPIDENKRTPLHYAARFGFVSVVNLLIDYGADIFANDKNGLTPLDHASSKNQIAVIEVFNSHGMDTYRDNYEAPPLREHTRNPKWGSRGTKQSEEYSD